MNTELQIRVYRQRSLRHSMPLPGSLQIGRQRPGEPAPFHFDPQAKRLLIAALDDKLVSREHLQLEMVASAAAEPENRFPRVRVTNLSRKRSVQVARHGRLLPEQETLVEVPVEVTFEDFALRIEPAPDSSTWEVRSLVRPTLAPGQPSGQLDLKTQQSILQASIADTPPADQLIHWLSEMMVVLQHAAGTEDFLDQAVDAVDRIVGLDAVLALRLEDGQWHLAASRNKPAQASRSEVHAPSRTILQHLLDKRSTVYHLPASMHGSASLQGVKALVASPILDASGEVIGALYGARFSSPQRQVPQISELEATMVEVVACSAAAGIARQQQQQEALQAKILFEQYFSPQLARELESNPGLLDANEAEISILFCDIVGFSAVSQRIGSHMTMQWISEVMEVLSLAVENNAGVVVDYIGDELMAMWGAPKPQADHAVQACLAAHELLACCDPIDREWRERTGQAINFRIGICSGRASVGNTGSIRRLKYGPLGNTVNLACRLQSAAKQFGVRLLVSATTAAAVREQPQLICRPLGTAKFVNISAPVEVFELGSRKQPEHVELSSRYAHILQAWKNAEWEQARRQLREVADCYPHDGPTQRLLERLQGPGRDPACVWPLESK